MKKPLIKTLPNVTKVNKTNHTEQEKKESMATQVDKKAERAKMLEKFMKENPPTEIKTPEGGTVQVHGEVAQPTPAPEAPAPVPVEPKKFQTLPSQQGGVEARTIVMSMADIYNYTCYAKDLYKVEEGQEIQASETWQRVLNKKRAENEIGPYLLQETHFFPPLIVLPTSDDVSLDENGVLTVTEHSLAALDGQHRKAGIDFEFQQLGPDSDFAKETMPVVVITSELDIDNRQQIFADVNRTAKVVSKALNILYDHRDQYAVISQAISAELGPVVELTRTVPTPKSNCIASLSNIYNLANNFSSTAPQKHASPMREGLDARTVAELCVAVINALPMVDKVKAGHATYAEARQGFICYSSTLFQAIGNALSHRLRGFEDTASMIATAVDLIQNTNWRVENPMWAKPNQPVIINGKVATRKENVTYASSILETLWSKPQDGEEATQPATPTEAPAATA